MSLGIRPAADTMGRGMSSAKHLSGELFDASQYEEEPILTQEEWLDRPNVTYHGTYREDWQEAPLLHAGTKQQALKRLEQVAKRSLVYEDANAAYYLGGPRESIDGEDLDYRRFEHVGRVHAIEREGPAPFQFEGAEHSLEAPYEGATLEEIEERHGRRFGPGQHPTLEESGPLGMHDWKLSDADANAAHWAFLVDTGWDSWEVSQSVRDSSDEDLMTDYELDYHPDPLPEEVRDAVSALSDDKSVAYENFVEGSGAVGGDHTTYMVPRAGRLYRFGGYRTYDSYIAEHPRSSDAAKRYARERIHSGLAGSVQFEVQDPDLNKPGPWNQQGVLVDRHDAAAIGYPSEGNHPNRTLDRLDVTTYMEGTEDEGQVTFKHLDGRTHRSAVHRPDH